MSREEGRYDVDFREDYGGGERKMVDRADRGGLHKLIGVVIR